MKRHTIVFLIAALCLCLFCSYQTLNGQAQAQAKPAQAASKAADPIITVLNPLGTPPPLELKAMAPRLNTIEGKTLYIVDDGYPGSDNLLLELEIGTCVVLSPPIANFVKDGGFDTVEKFTAYVTGVPIGSKPAPFAGKPNDGSRRAGGTFTVIVTGASNNNYFSIGGWVPTQSVRIDKWR